MTRFQRRSWAPPRVSRHDQTRLGGMIGLLIVVMVLIQIAWRPQLWSTLLPAGMRPTVSQPATPTADNSAPIATHDRAASRTSYTFIALIIAAACYFGWRLSRISRALYGAGTRRPIFESRLKLPPIERKHARPSEEEPRTQ